MDETAIISAQRAAYGTNFQAHGDTPRGTFQNDRTTQGIRFEALLKHIGPHLSPGTTIHDLGSGLCDLYGYLVEVGLGDRVTYSGTEIVEEMNLLARSKYPGLTLLNRNFLEVSESYDFCVASGTFNLLGGVSEEDWRKLCLSLIAAMFRSARKGIAFNVLTSYRTFSDPTLCYFDPREMFDFLTTTCSRFVTADAMTPLYEVTFTVLQRDYLASINPGDALKKYFR